MDNLKQIVEILITNIGRSDLPIPIALQNEVNSLSPDDFKPLVLLSHRRNHKNIVFTLKNCDKKHCIECLLGLRKCEHNILLTHYELAHIKFITGKLQDDNYKMQGVRFCKVCKFSDSPYRFAYKPCFCECVNCIHKRIIDGKRTCSVCSSEYGLFYIEEMYQRLNLFFPGFREECSGCNLPISTEGFKTKQCFVCYKIASFL